MTTLSKVSFQKTVLASLIGLFLNQSVFALEEISDESLSETTGEGIAFLPENFAMVFRGENAGNETVANIVADRTKDTGYIRYIPVGPLSSSAPATAGKADLFLYGLSISKGDGNLNNRLGSDPTIRSWGTADNPWLFKVQTDSNIPNFGNTVTPANNCTTTPDNCKVTYLALEAPRHEFYALNYTDTTKNVGNTIPVSSAAGADAYNLKLAFWADAFVRDPKKAEGASDQFDLISSGRANRLRLQAVWDGLSINGSQIQMFQTLGGAVAGAGGGYIKDTSYNNTLGLAGVLRFNSGDTRADGTSGFKANITTTGGTAATSSYVDDAGNVITGSADNTWINRYSPSATTVPSGTTTAQGSTNCNTPGGSAAFVCSYQIRSRTTRVSNAYANGTWTTPSLVNNGVLRFSTRETGAVQGKLDSPAVNGVTAPTFDANEGLYAYGANINLVLGTLYQPLMVNKDSTSNNLVLEVAAIPNKPDLYKKIYTAYAGNTGSLTTAQIAEYQGSTCSVYACGTPIVVNGVKTYQGVNATHSSISIGSTQYDPNTGLMTAYKGADAVGVSFGALPTGTVSPTGQNYYYYELQNRERRRGSSNTNWQYCTAGNSTGACTTWGVNNTGGGLNFNSRNAAWKTSAGTSLYNPTVPQNGYSYNDTTNGTPFTVPSAGSLPQANSSWDAVNKQWVSRWDGTTWSSSSPAALGNFANATIGDVQQALSNTQFTNLGSAVIDGMLIQHMKITTKGL
ncbi:hypothetical protein ACG93T_02185 [Acinetobacter beijerinckii]|uniref:hypothetical protein n=1 Tax=Acinetobacter beijerinckii TaxID=262668 RepID=UPI003AF84436